VNEYTGSPAIGIIENVKETVNLIQKIDNLDGGVVKSRFREWADSVFEWTTPTGVVRTPRGDVERIGVRDPIRDGILRGALIGAGAGGALGTLVGVGLSCKRDCGPGYSRTRDVLGGALAFALVAAGEGVAVGAILDATIYRRRLVYSKPRTSRVVLAPIVDTSQVGAAAVVRW
jgi:hypothetical protein